MSHFPKARRLPASDPCAKPASSFTIVPATCAGGHERSHQPPGATGSASASVGHIGRWPGLVNRESFNVRLPLLTTTRWNINPPEARAEPVALNHSPVRRCHPPEFAEFAFMFTENLLHFSNVAQAFGDLPKKEVKMLRRQKVRSPF